MWSGGGSKQSFGFGYRRRDVTRDDRALVGRDGENDCVSTLPPSTKNCQLDVRVLKRTTFTECEEDARCMKSEGTLSGGDMNVENECARGITSTAVKAPSENDCVWGIRGFCKTHKSYGKKYTTSSKDWKLKKDGTFGENVVVFGQNFVIFSPC